MLFHLSGNGTYNIKGDEGAKFAVLWYRCVRQLRRCGEAILTCAVKYQAGVLFLNTDVKIDDVDLKLAI